jgi:hypothetical protein
MADTFDTFAVEFAAIVDEQPGELTPDCVLETIPLWDSVAIVTFMALGIEKFGKILDPGRIASAVTIADLHALVAAA